MKTKPKENKKGTEETETMPQRCTMDYRERREHIYVFSVGGEEYSGDDRALRMLKSNLLQNVNGQYLKFKAKKKLYNYIIQEYGLKYQAALPSKIQNPTLIVESSCLKRKGQEL